MWTLKHGAALRQAYPQPWQRIEAFRMLLSASGKSWTVLDKLPTNAAKRLDIEALLRDIWGNLGAVMGEYSHLRTICLEEADQRLA